MNKHLLINSPSVNDCNNTAISVEIFRLTFIMNSDSVTQPYWVESALPNWTAFSFHSYLSCFVRFMSKCQKLYSFGTAIWLQHMRHKFLIYFHKNTYLCRIKHIVFCFSLAFLSCIHFKYDSKNKMSTMMGHRVTLYTCIYVLAVLRTDRHISDSLS
jgi:hypothetical protein